MRIRIFVRYITPPCLPERLISYVPTPWSGFLQGVDMAYKLRILGASGLLGERSGMPERRGRPPGQLIG